MKEMFPLCLEKMFFPALKKINSTGLFFSQIYDHAKYLEKNIFNSQNWITPKKDNEIPPTIVIKITDNKISRPGIEKGR